MAIKKPGQPESTPPQTVVVQAPITTTTTGSLTTQPAATESEATRQRRIRRSGLIQAAAQSPGVTGAAKNFEDYKAKVKEMAEDMLLWVEA